jgi:hypothetical protein
VEERCWTNFHLRQFWSLDAPGVASAAGITFDRASFEAANAAPRRYSFDPAVALPLHRR